MDEVYRWDRDDKLFAIKALKGSQHPDRERYLLQLVVDEDPVVRGKAALAMKSCSDTTLLEAAEGLLEQNDSGKTILACEILGFTENVDFTETIRPLLEHDDERVVRSAIEVLDRIPPDRAIDLLKDLVDRYDENWAKSLKRVLSRIKTPEILDVLERLFERVDNDFRSTLLRIAAGLDDNKARSWVESRMNQLELPEAKSKTIEWLLDHRS